MPAQNIGWLDIGMREDSQPAILDHGRLRQVVSALPNPESQYPSLCVFIGKRPKQRVLQELYSLNNIKRHRSRATIRLRYDVASSESRHPILFADSDDLLARSAFPSTRLQASLGHAISWNCDSAKMMILILWTRLIFLFADVICLFVENEKCIKEGVEFLISCSRLQTASSLSSIIRPKVILMFDDIGDNRMNRISLSELLSERLSEPDCDGLSITFSKISLFNLYADHTSPLAHHERIKAAMTKELDAMRLMRQENQFQPNACHLMALFESAFRHVILSIDRPFDVISAVRQARPLSTNIQSHLIHYFEAANRAKLPLREVTRSVSSAILMDHYVPRTIALDPRMVFKALYQAPLSLSYQSISDASPEDQIDQIEAHFVSLFASVEAGEPSIRVRAEQLKSQSGQLCRIRSNKICLYCLFEAAQHTLACGHTLCDRCIQVFGAAVQGFDYRFTITGCLYCLYQRPLIVDILPPTMSPSILAIDGGGVKGVIPLEFLILLQEHLMPCTIQDVIDLAVGTSSGGLTTLGLFVMQWDVRKCSHIFEELAYRIFSERRHSIFLYFLRRINRHDSFLGETARWIQWFLRDSCYDARVFDTALQNVFGESRRIFGANQDDNHGPLWSGPKVGVVATGISRDTSTFVIGNFNAVHDSGYHIIRPNDPRHEPQVWKAARATAAAPFFFTPIDLQGIGSFQDGGLKHNFSGALATEICHQLWPESIGSVRILSLGTGIGEASDNQTPHFRHIFRDSFLRRGFDAWMSSMDTEHDWRMFRKHLVKQGGTDFHRLNVPLGKAPDCIDAVGAIEEYRNLVLLQPGSARMARDAATMLLVSRFYFVIGQLPENTVAPFWCRGVIRCKGRAKNVIMALDRLYPDGLEFFSDSGSIGTFNGASRLCSLCGCYNHPISFISRHIDQEMDVFLRSSSKKRWRISGFPASAASIAIRQSLNSSFGRNDHNTPNREPCRNCDTSGLTRGVRRRRESKGSRDENPKKVRLSPMLEGGGID